MKITTIYLHSEKDSMIHEAKEIGLTDAALRYFKYTASEVAIRIEIDEDTGKAMATHFNDVALTQKALV
jgi:hypothetical protein